VNIPGVRAPRPLGLLVVGLLVGQVICSPAWATLGEDATTTENDRVQMKAQLRTTSVAGYTVHEIQTPEVANAVIREYISASGKVFAVTWKTPQLPNFRQIFGRYYAEYHNSANSPRVGRRHLEIHGSDLVISSNGHMRAFYGVAYVPSLLPPNFSPGELK
jgi:uncharacterized protein DUF2844